MQRDRLDVASRNVDWIETDATPTQPALCITYHGWRTEPCENFTTPDGGPYPEGEIDIAFRLQSSSDTDTESGVLSLAHCLTGELLLEATTDARMQFYSASLTDLLGYTDPIGTSSNSCVANDGTPRPTSLSIGPIPPRNTISRRATATRFPGHRTRLGSAPIRETTSGR